MEKDGTCFFCPVDLYIAFLPLYLLFFCWVHAGCLGVDWWPTRNRRVGLGKVEAFTGLKLYCIYRYIFDLVIFVIGYWAWYLYIYIELIYCSWLVNLNLVTSHFYSRWEQGWIHQYQSDWYLIPMKTSCPHVISQSFIFLSPSLNNNSLFI